MKSKLQKSFSIPFTILLKKIAKFPFKGILNKLNYKKERRAIEKYLHNDFEFDLNFFDTQIDKFVDYSYDIDKINNYLGHKFDLLGSGLVEIAYNSVYPGFIGHNYSNPLSITNNDHLLKLLPNEHHNYSLKIRNLISRDYNPIDWFVDFRSGFRWKCVFYNKIKYGNKVGVDIKVPWELARLQHLLELSVSVKFLPDATKTKVVNEIKNQLLDFISMNPPFYGPNWVSPMEISIRSFNIIYTIIELYKNNIVLEKKFLKIITNYLSISLEFIELHNEWNDGLRNNHYLANLLGITVISKFLNKNLNNINKIINLFKKELEIQFFSDGGNFEGSIPYHFFSYEIIVWIVSLLKDQLLQDKSITTKLQKIEEFNKTFENISIENIQIGDNDSGKIISLNKLNRLSCINDILLNNNTNQNKNNELKIIDLKEYPNFGLIANKNQNYIIYISTGRKAQMGKGGHNHNDSQSFILLVENNPFFVDPGTFVYTASIEERNYYRSMQSHNKLVIEGQSEFDTDRESLFWFYDKKLGYKKAEMPNFSLIEFIDKNLLFNRSFSLYNQEIIIEDKINKKFTNILSLFHLHSTCKTEIISDSKLLIRSNKTGILFETNGDFKLEDYYFSPSYGTKLLAKKIVIKPVDIFQNLIYKIKILQ